MIPRFLITRSRNVCGQVDAYLLLSAALLLGGKAVAQLEGGQIRGKVVVSAHDELTDELMRGRSLTRYEMHMHGSNEMVPPYRLSEKAVIYLESVPPAGYSVPPVHPRLNQTQMLFRPLVMAILAGTTVDFPNNDNLFHNVFSYSQTKEFDLGRYPRGQQRSIRFDIPGIVKVYCDIHSYMYATILVLDHTYFTVPDDDGNFILDDVPPGKYTLTFWYGRKIAATKSVVIQDGKTTMANFEF